MKELESLYDCEPPQFSPSADSESRTRFFRRFCDEQPHVVAFLTKYGTSYSEYKLWTGLSVLLAQKLWWNFLGNDLKLPKVKPDALERHYIDNKEFVEKRGVKARDRGLNAINRICRNRPQASLRILVLATLFDATQHPLIGPRDKSAAPKLVRDQNHLHALLGAVLESFDEVAIERGCAQNC